MLSRRNIHIRVSEKLDRGGGQQWLHFTHIVATTTTVTADITASIIVASVRVAAAVLLLCEYTDWLRGTVHRRHRARSGCERDRDRYWVVVWNGRSEGITIALAGCRWAVGRRERGRAKRRREYTSYYRRERD